jgi:hypothetical protein
VLKSDLRSLLYGDTEIGGSTNYTSFDSGGIQSFRNVVSSQDVVKLGNNQYVVWLGNESSSDLFEFPIGVSTNNAFVIPTSIDVVGNASFDSLTANSLTFQTFNFNALDISGGVSADSLHVVNTFRSLVASGISTLVNVSSEGVLVRNDGGVASVVIESDAATSADAVTTYRNATTGQAWQTGIKADTESYEITFGQNFGNNSAVRIDTNGRVGIGMEDDTITTELQVKGSASFDGVFSPNLQMPNGDTLTGNSVAGFLSWRANAGSNAFGSFQTAGDEGQSATVRICADEADDDPDCFILESNPDNTLQLKNNDLSAGRVILRTDTAGNFRDIQSISAENVTVSGLTVTTADITSAEMTQAIITQDFVLPRTTTAGDYSTDTTAVIIEVTDTSSPRTVTLSSGDVTQAGRIYIIKDGSDGASANNITLTTSGGETIDDETSHIISSDSGYVGVYADGTGWQVFKRNRL